MKKWILAGLASAIVLAQPMAAFGQERPEVQELANRWTAAYNRGDVSALRELYADDAELYIHNDGRYVGQEAIQEYWASDMTRSSPITVLHVTDAVSDPEMMLVHGNYQVLDRTNGVPLGSGRFAHLWVLDQEWVLDRDVWVDNRE